MLRITTLLVALASLAALSSALYTPELPLKGEDIECGPARRIAAAELDTIAFATGQGQLLRDGWYKKTFHITSSSLISLLPGQ